MKERGRGRGGDDYEGGNSSSEGEDRDKDEDEGEGEGEGGAGAAVYALERSSIGGLNGALHLGQAVGLAQQLSDHPLNRRTGATPLLHALEGEARWGDEVSVGAVSRGKG